MAHILIMPRQGNTVESCIITEWKVKEGDTVTPETAVCEVETDKAAFEVHAGEGGIVLKLLHDSGDDVPILQPIAVIGAAGEDWQITESKEQGAESKEQLTKNREQKAEIAKTETFVNRSLLPVNHSASPRARKLAAKEALPLETIQGTGPGGRIIERDIIAALQDRPVLTVAAKAAIPGAIPAVGSGIGGRVTLADLSSTVPCSLLTDNFTETPIKGIRKVIAERMRQSLAETAQYTLNTSASAVKLQAFRAGIKANEKIAEETGLSKITINDLVLFALSRTLPRFSYMNAHKTGDVIKTFEQVHLGLAVDTPKGLLVPVIRNANLLSLAQISSEAKRLAAACQNGTAKPDELSGSTFTVSNLGSLGITSFTPLINIPEVAVLGVCSIELKPITATPHITFEPHIGFSLTINHEIVDGAPAARFLKALCEAVANIDLLLAAG